MRHRSSSSRGVTTRSSTSRWRADFVVKTVASRVRRSTRGDGPSTSNLAAFHHGESATPRPRCQPRSAFAESVVERPQLTPSTREALHQGAADRLGRRSVERGTGARANAAHELGPFTVLTSDNPFSTSRAPTRCAVSWRTLRRVAATRGARAPHDWTRSFWRVAR